MPQPPSGFSLRKEVAVNVMEKANCRSQIHKEEKLFTLFSGAMTLRKPGQTPLVILHFYNFCFLHFLILLLLGLWMQDNYRSGQFVDTIKEAQGTKKY